MYLDHGLTHLGGMTCDYCPHPVRGHAVTRPDFHGHLDCWVLATLHGHTIGGTLSERLERACS